MSWRNAPLYVEVHDLAVWTMDRTGTWRDRNAATLAERVAGAVCDLVTSVALGLTFPATRGRHLEAADEAIVRLRTLLRLAEALGLLSPRGLRFAAGRLQAAGRMLGGWRKRQVAEGG